MSDSADTRNGLKKTNVLLIKRMATHSEIWWLTNQLCSIIDSSDDDVSQLAAAQALGIVATGKVYAVSV